MVTSPCTGICKINEATGWCLGCGRSGEEIAEWRNLPEPLMEKIWTEIPARLTHLGVTCRRLPWTTNDIKAFVIQSLERHDGTWVMGVVGAVAEFTAKPGASIDITNQGDQLVASTEGGAMRMVINDDVRALTFDAAEATGRPRIVLAVKRERGRPPIAQGIEHLGEDNMTLIVGSATQLFDLGIGRKEARFCVRVGDGSAKDALIGANGKSLAESLPIVGPTLISDSPDRVIETALGRIEVRGKIPPPESSSPLGPHTHLLPDHLAQNRAMPVGMDLPRAYLPGALFYPAN